MMQVVDALQSDVESWLSLAPQVEYLFGPMLGYGFEGAIQSNMNRGSAFCVRGSQNASILAGAILFDYRGAPDYEISWLAVDSAHRRCGIGGKPVQHALDRTLKPSVLKVVTFGPVHPGGSDARRFYESFGFVLGNLQDPGPEGGSRQEYTLEQSCT